MRIGFIENLVHFFFLTFLAGWSALAQAGVPQSDQLESKIYQLISSQNKVMTEVLDELKDHLVSSDGKTGLLLNEDGVIRGFKLNDMEQHLLEMGLSAFKKSLTKTPPVMNRGYMQYLKQNRAIKGGPKEQEKHLVVGAGWDETYLTQKQEHMKAERDLEKAGKPNKLFEYETSILDQDPAELAQTKNGSRYTIDPSPGMKADMVADFLNVNQMNDLPDGSFDKIYLEGVPCQITLVEEFYSNLQRLLKPGGQILLVTGRACRALLPAMMSLGGIDLKNVTFKSPAFIISKPLPPAPAAPKGVATFKGIMEDGTKVYVCPKGHLILVPLKAVKDLISDMGKVKL